MRDFPPRDGRAWTPQQPTPTAQTQTQNAPAGSEAPPRPVRTWQGPWLGVLAGEAWPVVGWQECGGGQRGLVWCVMGMVSTCFAASVAELLGPLLVGYGRGTTTPHSHSSSPPPCPNHPIHPFPMHSTHSIRRAPKPTAGACGIQSISIIGSRSRQRVRSGRRR